MTLGEPFGAVTPTSWTFRMKFNKSTTLIHINPTQSFDALKVELLKALKETHPNGLLCGHRIPEKPDDILLAKPTDIYDYTKGWTALDGDESLVDSDEAKPAKKKGKADVNIPQSSPKAAGLQENSVLAFRFTDDEDEGLGLNDQQWDVVIPSFEDATGVVNEGDVGGIQHFEG